MRIFVFPVALFFAFPVWANADEPGEEFLTPGNRVDLQGRRISAAPVAISGDWRLDLRGGDACVITFERRGSVDAASCTPPISSARTWRFARDAEGASLVLLDEANVEVWRGARGENGGYTSGATTLRPASH